MMITVVKLDPRGKEKIRYQAQVLAHLENGVVVEAYWNHPRRDLGYAVFETGDRFTEYFYTNRWFNVFAIFTANGIHKGWYCNVAAPAQVSDEYIEQIDLLLDVWVSSTGQPIILDEDEFAAAMTLTEQQRSGAQQGLQELLSLIAMRHEPFHETD